MVGDQTNTIDVGILPPFSRKEFIYNYQTKSSFSKIKDNILLSFADVQISKPIVITPIYFLAFSPAFAISVVVALLIITIGLVLYRKLHRNKVPVSKDLL